MPGSITYIRRLQNKLNTKIELPSNDVHPGLISEFIGKTSSILFEKIKIAYF